MFSICLPSRHSQGLESSGALGPLPAWQQSTSSSTGGRDRDSLRDDNSSSLVPEQLLDSLSAVTQLLPRCRAASSSQPASSSSSPVASLSLAQTLFPPAAHGPVPWEPVPGRYLLALCVAGRSSNHLLCLRRYAVLAALLSRALIVPAWHRIGVR